MINAGSPDPQNTAVTGAATVLPLNAGCTVMVTSLLLEVQLPLVMVQRKTYVPVVRPVTVVFGADGVVITCVPGPLTFVHVPEPTVGVLPASVVLVAAQSVCTGPATDVVGCAYTICEDVLMLLQPVPDGPESHSFCGSVGGAASGFVASGSVTSFGRMIEAVNTILPPDGTADAVPVTVNVTVAALFMLRFAVYCVAATVPFDTLAVPVTEELTDTFVNCAG